MNIFMDRVDFYSSAGPHWFGQKLADAFLRQNCRVTGMGENLNHVDVQLSFVQASIRLLDVPLFQRLDGIWYNSETDYKKMNEPIKETYQIADGVIFQSRFDHDFITHHFGPHDNWAIIHNGADLKYISSIKAAVGLDDFETVWCCASSWVGEPPDNEVRHVKRLNENIRFFQEHSGDRDILCVAGNTGNYENPDPAKIVFLGNLSTDELLSLYRRSKYFIHLAKQDHCPNVVVDARGAGCHIICSSSGGTREIAGPTATVIYEEDEFGFEAYPYNVESTLDFSRTIKNDYDANISINYAAKLYLDFMKGV